MQPEGRHPGQFTWKGLENFGVAVPEEVTRVMLPRRLNIHLEEFMTPTGLSVPLGWPHAKEG